MNDRLKFRVWDKRQNEYIKEPNPMPLLQANGLLAYFTDNPKAMDFYDVEFCTGLKDKNGKLVFEGDVICIEDFKRDSCGIYENYLGFVYWDNKNLCWAVKDGHCDLSWFDIEGYDIEVIGNIHQDSHLLENNGIGGK